MSVHIKYTLTHGDKVLPLDERTVIMGAVNCTPDSFSDGGQFKSADEAVDRALRMVEEGADFLYYKIRMFRRSIL